MPFTSKSGLINIKIILYGTAVMALLVIFRIYSYLLFHTTVEIIGVIIAFGIFMFAWNSRKFAENDFILFLGISFFFIASIDLMHAFAYYGMTIFTGYGKSLAVELWIIGRYFQAFSMLAAPMFITRRINVSIVFTVYFLFTLLSFSLIFSGRFPVCFDDVTGLTQFKIISEFVVCIIFIISILFLYKCRKNLDIRIFKLLAISISATIISELYFTLYHNLYGLSNMIGHCLKIFAYYYIYEAIIEKGLREPYSLLFRNLKQREQELTKTLDEVKTLKGIIPICASCKKIRDDSGYWNQIELYIKEHSDADFSHSICPDCVKKLYPDLYIDDK
jgi:hypothetical protein